MNNLEFSTGYSELSNNVNVRMNSSMTIMTCYTYKV